jgi:hypothetical protein
VHVDRLLLQERHRRVGAAEGQQPGLQALPEDGDAERRRGREEGGVIVLSDSDAEAPAPTNPVRSGDPGQGCSKEGSAQDDDDDDGSDYTAFYQLLGMN